MYRRVLTALAAGVVALVPTPASATHSSGLTERVSVDNDGNQLNAINFSPDISADGFRVLFDSGDSAVLVRDRLEATTVRADVSSAGVPGNAPSGANGISADGRFVVFSGQASNLVPGDTNNCPFFTQFPGQCLDVLVHDLQTGATERVSVASDGSQANERSAGASVSGDGRFVAFFSDASNLVPGDTAGTRDAFVHDRVTGVTELVSVASAGTRANGFSTPPRISANGRFVAFASFAANLVPGDTNGTLDVFVHDRVTGTTERVSVASDGTQADGLSALPAISDDGRFVGFASDASNLVLGDTNGTRDVFMHDRLTGTTERVNVSSAGSEANAQSGFSVRGGSSAPDISADGRFVSFDSFASNLVLGDTNAKPDGFVRDRLTGTTTRESVSSSGAEGNDGSSSTAINADGGAVAFVSLASNLVANDTNACSFFTNGHCPDIFVRGGPAVNADVRVVKSASPDPALIGRPLTYTVALANDGPFAATRVRLTDTLPASVLFASAASTAGTCGEADGVVTCNLGTLASGAGATVTIVVRPTRLGTITNTATATAPQTDPNQGNNTATVATTVVPN